MTWQKVAIALLAAFMVLGAGYYWNASRIATPRVATGQVPASTVDQSKTNTNTKLDSAKIAPVKDTKDSAVTSTSTSKTEDSSNGCNMTLTVDGGTFTPNSCEVRLTSSGVPCALNQPCSGGISIVFVDNRKSGTSEPQNASSMTLYMSGLKSDTYQYKSSDSTFDLKGDLLDQGFASRSLTGGTVIWDNTAHRAMIDVTFSNGMRIRAIGILPVNHYDAS